MAGRSGDRIPVGARFSAPVQTGPGTHPASCTMGTVSFPGIKSGRGVTLTRHPLLVSWSRKSIATPLLPLWAVRPVQSLSACTRVQFTYLLHHRMSGPEEEEITAERRNVGDEELLYSWLTESDDGQYIFAPDLGLLIQQRDSTYFTGRAQKESITKTDKQLRA